MEQMRNEQPIYSAAVYCRLSKDDEQSGESVSIETQKMMLTDFCHERGYCNNNPVNDFDDDGQLSWLAKVAMGTASGAATGAIGHRLSSGSWDGAGQAALDGAADGYMMGAITGFISGGLSSNACFVAGTSIATAAGKVAIENIKAGDWVYATDPETGETALKQVVQTFENETTELVHLSVNGEEIVTTPSHPFWIHKKGWTAAAKLRAGDMLQLLNGEYVILEAVQYELLETPITVYNFEVEDFHTYYVTDSEILVHNVCGPKNTKTKWDLQKFSKGTKKVNFAGKNMTAHFDGKYYWLDDLTNHGDSAFKVFKKNGKYLEWVADADEFGNFILNKHKSSVGIKLKI